jgi:hypothetical protein
LLLLLPGAEADGADGIGGVELDALVREEAIGGVLERTKRGKAFGGAGTLKTEVASAEIVEEAVLLILESLNAVEGTLQASIDCIVASEIGEETPIVESLGLLDKKGEGVGLVLELTEEPGLEGFDVALQIVV